MKRAYVIKIYRALSGIAHEPKTVCEIIGVSTSIKKSVATAYNYVTKVAQEHPIAQPAVYEDHLRVRGCVRIFSGDTANPTVAIESYNLI